MDWTPFGSVDFSAIYGGVWVRFCCSEVERVGYLVLEKLKQRALKLSKPRETTYNKVVE